MATCGIYILYVELNLFHKFQWNLKKIQSGNNKYWQVDTRAVTKENVKEILRTYYENIGEEVVIRVSFPY